MTFYTFWLGGMLSTAMWMWAEWPIMKRLLTRIPVMRIVPAVAISVLAWLAYIVLSGIIVRNKDDF